MGAAGLLADYPIPILFPMDVLLNLNRMLIAVDIALSLRNLMCMARMSGGWLRRSDRGGGLSLNGGGGRWIRRCTRISIVPSFAFLLSSEIPLSRSFWRQGVVIPSWWALAITFAIRTDRGWRHRGLQPGTGSHLRHRTFGKHELIKDGLRSREDDIVGGTHENPSFSSRGGAQVGHQLGFWRKFICAHFSRDEDICSAAEDPKMVYRWSCTGQPFRGGVPFKSLYGCPIIDMSCMVKGEFPPGRR